MMVLHFLPLQIQDTCHSILFVLFHMIKKLHWNILVKKVQIENNSITKKDEVQSRKEQITLEVTRGKLLKGTSIPVSMTVTRYLLVFCLRWLKMSTKIVKVTVLRKRVWLWSQQRLHMPMASHKQHLTNWRMINMEWSLQNLKRWQEL